MKSYSWTQGPCSWTQGRCSRISSNSSSSSWSHQAFFSVEVHSGQGGIHSAGSRAQAPSTPDRRHHRSRGGPISGNSPVLSGEDLQVERLSLVGVGSNWHSGCGLEPPPSRRKLSTMVSDLEMDHAALESALERCRDLVGREVVRNLQLQNDCLYLFSNVSL